ncbi:MAG: ArsR/SmtB family transcription factor [Fluviicola sp.]
MASIKRTGFSKETNQQSNIFKALGHPARLTIIESLINEGRIKCKEIELSLPLAPTTANRHMRVLFEQGIIGYEKILNETHYVLNPIALDAATTYLKDQLEQHNRELTDYSEVYFHMQPTD